jgi:hypothetical protein
MSSDGKLDENKEMLEAEINSTKTCCGHKKRCEDLNM